MQDVKVWCQILLKYLSTNLIQIYFLSCSSKVANKRYANKIHTGMHKNFYYIQLKLFFCLQTIFRVDLSIYCAIYRIKSLLVWFILSFKHVKPKPWRKWVTKTNSISSAMQYIFSNTRWVAYQILIGNWEAIEISLF